MPENKTNNKNKQSPINPTENQARMLSGKPPIGMPEREGGYAPHEYMDYPTEVPFETKHTRKLIMGGFDERQIAVRGFVFTNWFWIGVALALLTAFLYGNSTVQLVSLTGMVCGAAIPLYGCMLELSLRDAYLRFDAYKNTFVVILDEIFSFFPFILVLFNQFVFDYDQVLNIDEKKALLLPFDIVFGAIAVVLFIIFNISKIAGYAKQKKQSKLSE